MPDSGRSANEVKIRAAMAMSSSAKLDKLWKGQTISFGVKLRLLRSILISVLLYGCKSWTYNEEIVKTINAFEFKCYRRLLGIFWRIDAHKRVSERTVGRLSGSTETPTSNCTRAEKKFFGHVTRHPTELRLANTIMYGRAPGNRGRGRPRTEMLDNRQL